MRLFTFLASAFALAAAASLEPAGAAEPDVARDTLPAEAAPLSYDIVLEPDIAARTFKGEARLSFKLTKKAARIVVNGLDLKIASAMLDGETPAVIEVDPQGEKIAFVFDEPVRKGEHRLDVEYSGLINQQAVGLFLTEYPTPGGEQSMLASQFEPGDARRLAPMWDEPSLKAVFRLSAIVPEGMDAVSNMPVAQTGPATSGKVRIDFAPSPKMSSYLLYFGAGDFDRISRKLGDVEIAIISQAGEAEKGRYALDSTAQILSYYNDYFDEPYPLPKLDEIAVPGGGGFGAMENWGAILYFERLLLIDPKLSTPADKQRIFEVIAHEVAHQWFGDLVTMAWWDDLWLNEGFASWMETKITDILNPEWSRWLQSLAGKERAISLDSVSSSHPIVQPVRNIEEATLAFDAITYQKGQAVIRMIEAYVGEEAFRDGVRRYMKKHKYGNAETDDLWREVEASSKAPVTEIAHDFTTQAGVPLIIVDDAACDKETQETHLTLRQGRYSAVAGAKPQAAVWRTPVTAEIVGAEDIARATISGPKPQTMIAAGCGPVKVNVAETGYFRTLYADAPFEALTESFAELRAEDQLGLLYDAYALGASGDAPFTRFLDLVEKTPASADPVIVGDVASQLVKLQKLFEGETGGERFTEFARAWLRRAFAKIGWDAADGESENVAILRADLIGALAAFDDEAVIAEARKRFAAYRKDPAALSPGILSAVIGVVAAKADAKTFDRLLAKARGATTGREQRLYYIALAGVEDEALARRAIDEFLSEKTPVQLSANLLSALSGEHPALVWSYYRENFESVDKLLDPLRRLDYGAGIASASKDAAIADELEAFAAEHLPESAKTAVASAAERIRFAASVRKERLPELVARLETRG